MDAQQSTEPGMELLRRAVGLASCMFVDAQNEPCGSAAEALFLLQQGHGFIGRGDVQSGLSLYNRADRMLANVHYLTPDGVHGS